MKEFLDKALRTLDVIARFCSRVLVVCCIVLMLAPIAIIVILSFSNHDFMQFPPSVWGMRQYAHLISSESWMAAVKLSIVIAAGTALSAVAIAVPAVLALHRTSLPGQGAIGFAAIVPLLIPHVAYAVGMYGLISDMHLVATRTGLTLSHIAITFPLVFLVVSASITRIPEELELVAMTLGAARWRAWAGVTVPLLLPAIAAGALMTFVTSFDEPVFASFLGGPGLVTLPKAIFDSVLLGIDPVITAIATILIVFTGAAIGCVNWLQRR